MGEHGFMANPNFRRSLIWAQTVLAQTVRGGEMGMNSVAMAIALLGAPTPLISGFLQFRKRVLCSDFK